MSTLSPAEGSWTPPRGPSTLVPPCLTLVEMNTIEGGDEGRRLKEENTLLLARGRVCSAPPSHAASHVGVCAFRLSAVGCTWKAKGWLQGVGRSTRVSLVEMMKPRKTNFQHGVRTDLVWQITKKAHTNLRVWEYLKDWLIRILAGQAWRRMAIRAIAARSFFPPPPLGMSTAIDGVHRIPQSQYIACTSGWRREASRTVCQEMASDPALAAPSSVADNTLTG